MLFSSVSCGITHQNNNENEIPEKYRKYVSTAVSLINRTWRNRYASVDETEDKTANIINTRLILIKENDNEYFKDVKAVVEFDIFSNFYGTAPYYFNLLNYDTVTFYKSKSPEVFDLFNRYRNQTYETDYSQFIDSIIDLGSGLVWT